MTKINIAEQINQHRRNFIGAAAITAASQRLGAACQACHQVYRERDPVTNAYRVKRESVP